MAEQKIDLLKRKISSIKNYYLEKTDYSDKRQHKVDDNITFSHITGTSILTGLSLNLLNEVAQNAFIIKFLFLSGLSFLIISLLFSLVHLHKKNKFWRNNGRNFSKVFGLWASAEDRALLSDDEKLIENMINQTKLAEDSILGGEDHISQEGWASYWQSFFLIIGAIFEVISVFMILF